MRTERRLCAVWFSLTALDPLFAMQNDAAAALRDATRERERLRQGWDSIRNREVLNLLVLTAPRLLRCERVGIFVSAPDHHALWLEAGTGVTERQIVVAAENSMVGLAMRSGNPVVRQNLPNVTGAHRAVGGEVRFTVHDALTVPVYNASGTAAIGAIQVLNRTTAEPYAQTDIDTLVELAFLASTTIESLHNGQHLLMRARALDAQIEMLDRAESAIRGGRMLRTFEPADPVDDGGFLHHRYHGRMYPPFIDRAATIDLAESWDTDANDVFICTHQKVGTHLAKKYLVELVRSLCDLPPESVYATGDIGHGTVPWPEVMYSQHGRGHWERHLAMTQSVPRLWYTHCNYLDLPVRRIHPGSRFVVVVRDPRAVAVSQYFFWKRHPLLKVPPTLDLDSFVTRFVDGDLYFGDYHQHVLSWTQRPDERILPHRILVLRYEDLVERKLEVVEHLARFVAPGRKLEPELAEQIAASTDFDTMKSELTVNPQSFHLDPRVYFRAGTTRDWEQHLSDLAVESINQKTRAVWGADLECPPLAGAQTLTRHASHSSPPSGAT